MQVYFRQLFKGIVHLKWKFHIFTAHHYEDGGSGDNNSTNCQYNGIL